MFSDIYDQLLSLETPTDTNIHACFIPGDFIIGQHHLGVSVGVFSLIDGQYLVFEDVSRIVAISTEHLNFVQGVVRCLGNGKIYFTFLALKCCFTYEVAFCDCYLHKQINLRIL